MRDQLRTGGVAESVIDDAVLILSELLSNACRHGRPLGDALAGDGDVRAAWWVDASEPDPNMDDWVNDMAVPMQDFFTVNRVRITLNSMEAIANHLANLPGRKNLIWVSGSFPFSIGLDAPVTDGLAKLISCELPLEDWVALVRTKQPEPAHFEGGVWRRIAAWFRRLRYAASPSLARLPFPC